MPFVAALPNTGSRRIFVENGIEIAAGRQCLGNFLEAVLTMIGYGAVCRIRFHRCRNFGIELGHFARADSHFTPIRQRQIYLCAIASNNAFALTDDIAHFEATHFSGSVSGKGFTRQGRDFGDNLGLGHGNTPDTVFDAASVEAPNMQNN